MTNQIEFKNIYKIFGPSPEKAMELVRSGVPKEELLKKHHHTIGLEDINIGIPRGEAFVIMGLSGSGKSTLVRHINRLIDPTAGAVLINGENILDFDAPSINKFRQSSVSMVFQKFGLLPHKTVLENVAYGLQIRGDSKADRHEKSHAWIKKVGLDGYASSLPKQLSGGMQQRVGLARALATETDILLLDEPFSALDPLIRKKMQDLLVELQSELKKTLVFITHDLDEGVRIGERIALLKNGRQIQVDRPEVILSNPADDYVRDFVKDYRPD